MFNLQSVDNCFFFFILLPFFAFLLFVCALMVFIFCFCNNHSVVYFFFCIESQEVLLINLTASYKLKPPFLIESVDTDLLRTSDRPSSICYQWYNVVYLCKSDTKQRSPPCFFWAEFWLYRILEL